MSKRKARKTLIKQLGGKKALMKPILNIDTLGSDDDPCFGKLYDGNDDTCQRCGDSELCLIKMGNNNTKTRKKLEKKNSYKDIDETEFEINPQHIYKFIKSDVVTGDPVSLLMVAKKVNKQFKLSENKTKKEIVSLIRKIVKQAVDLDLKKKEGKTYVITA